MDHRPPTVEPELDVAALRAHFPALANGAAHFDGPGGTQTPDVVARAICDTLLMPLANRGDRTEAERNAEEAVRSCRAAVADLLAVDGDTVVFGRSATQLTFDLSRAISASWRPGDEVVVTRLDHDANIRPWVIAAARAEAVVRWADFDPATAELDAAAIAAAISDRTRLVAVTGASNLLGTKPDLAAIAALAHDAGALLYVDGVHYTPHTLVDLDALGADLFVCSPYKFFGPHCGVATGRAEILADLRPDKLAASSDRVPERFELGTLPYELMAGTTAAIDLLASAVGARGSRRDRLAASMTAIACHEARLCDVIETRLTAMPGVTIHSRATQRTPTLLLTFADEPAADMARHLAANGVNAPAGSFYALEASRHLGLGEDGGLRVGLAPYTDDNDVDRLLGVLAARLGGRRG